jgi:ABC-type phosphate transport system substrate-binding protein
VKLRRPASIAAAGAVSLGLVFATSGIANAAPSTYPNTGYGFDGNAHLIAGGGSTTLFKMVQSLSLLWGDTLSCNDNYSNYNPAGTEPVPYPQPTSTAAFNQCTPTPQSYSGTLTGGNFDGDTVAIANPMGSSTGIASLNGAHSTTAGTFAYEGTNTNLTTSGDPNALTLPGGDQLSDGYGTVDFDYSSRGPKTSGGNCAPSGDELTCDTFWGIASDGVGLYTFDTSSGVFVSQSGNPANVGLSAQDLFGIFNCDITTWGNLPEWQAAHAAGYSNLPDSAAPIIPWSMNSTSGTFGDFNAWIAANATGVPANWTIDNGCDREITSGGGATKSFFPLENDFKPIFEDLGTNAYNPGIYTWPTAGTAWGSGGTAEGEPPAFVGVNNLTTFPAGQSTNIDSPQNPANWLWLGSFGLLSTWKYLSSGTVQTPTGGITFSSGVNAISDTTASPGVAPSQSNIQLGSYPILRILNIVTKKSDADCPVTSGVCNFSQTANPGPTNGNGVADIDVLGATSGKGGAVREFVRFLCPLETGSFTAGTNVGPADSYTGNDMNGSGATGELVTGDPAFGIGGIEPTGFRPVPATKRSPGSACDVQSVG